MRIFFWVVAYLITLPVAMMNHAADARIGLLMAEQDGEEQMALLAKDAADLERAMQMIAEQDDAEYTPADAVAEAERIIRRHEMGADE